MTMSLFTHTFETQRLTLKGTPYYVECWGEMWTDGVHNAVVVELYKGSKCIYKTKEPCRWNTLDGVYIPKRILCNAEQYDMETE